MSEREVFTSCALASKVPFTLQVRLKGPMPREAQVRVMEEPSTTGLGDLGVMNGTGKAGGGGGRERGGGEGETHLTLTARVGPNTSTECIWWCSLTPHYTFTQ